MSFWREGSGRTRLLTRDRRLPPSWGDQTWMDHLRHEQTMEFLRPMNELTGPLNHTTLTLAPDLDSPCGVAYSGQIDFAHMFRGIEESLTESHIPTSGKGWGMPRAVMSSVGEGFERTLAMYMSFALRDEGRIVFASWRELDRKGEDAVHPSTFRWFHDKQYDHPLLPFARFDEDTKVGWVRGERFITGKPCWLPAQVACYLYPPYEGETIFGFTSSVGLAAGFGKKEAAIHGLYEFIERDAMNVRWGLNLMPRRIVGVPWEDLEPAFADRPALHNPHIEITAYDWTLDFPDVSTVAVHMVNTSLEIMSFDAGMVSRTDPVESVTGAWGEVAQGVRFKPLLAYFRRIGRVPGRFKIGEDGPLEEIDNLYKTIVYYGFKKNRKRLEARLATGGTVQWEDWLAESKGRRVPSDLQGEYDHLRRVFKQRGYDPVHVDLTPPGFERAKIVRTWVPEMTPYTIVFLMAGHPRYEEARRTLKLRDEPYGYEDFNHDPIPYP